MDLKHRVVRADGLTCPHCDGPVNFITPYYGRDECDLDNQMAGVWTWWPFIPFAELISAFRAMTGSSPGMMKELYHCSTCDVDLSYKKAIKVGT